MNHDKFNDSLSSLLDRGRVGYAISTLRGKCSAALPSHPDLSGVIRELDRTAETYSRMREFLLSGGTDPDRRRVLDELKEKVKALGRRYLFIINEDRLDPLFAEYRLGKVRPVSVADLLDDLEKTRFRIEMAAETEADPVSFLKRNEELTDRLFRRVWSLPPGATSDIVALDSFIASRPDFTLLSMVISALLLGLLKFNDPDKFMLLLKAYDTASDERIAARALTAIVIVLGRWGGSALSTPAVRGAVKDLEESLLTYSRVRDIVMTLIRTRDTDRVSREVNEAFTTTMREITPEMLERLQREGLTADSSETGFNPEWEKLLKNKEIEDRMKAINDMQMEGMDVMMQTFSRLKSFPFFRSVSNWFLPFNPSHSAIRPLFRSIDGEGFNAMAEATDMCAGDRFSFALGIMQMPEERRNLLSMQLGGQLETIRDALKDRENVRRRPVFGSEALVFARDLYRFAKLFPGRKDFYDPFEEPIDFLTLPLVGSLLEGDDIILTSADFYFRYGYYPLALSLYNRMVSVAGDRDLFEKIGFCHQMEGDYASALANYEKADLFSTDVDPASSWLLKKLAFCNKALGRYREAAACYGRLLERNPDDLNAEFHLGTVLLRCAGTPAASPGDFERGRQLVSKVHYMDPEHKFAARVYTRIKGHEAFIEGRYADAVNLYEAARGAQKEADYRQDLAAELRLFAPDADITALQILLDS